MAGGDDDLRAVAELFAFLAANPDKAEAWVAALNADPDLDDQRRSALRRMRELACTKMEGVHLVLREAVSVDQMDALSRGTIDIGLLRPIVNRSGVVTRPHMEDRLVAALPDGHLLATGHGVRMRQLDGLPLMMYSTSEARYFHDLVMRLYESAGAHPVVTQLASQVPALLAFVAANQRRAPVASLTTRAARRRDRDDGPARVGHRSGHGGPRRCRRARGQRARRRTRRR